MRQALPPDRSSSIGVGALELVFEAGCWFVGLEGAAGAGAAAGAGDCDQDSDEAEAAAGPAVGNWRDCGRGGGGYILLESEPLLLLLLLLVGLGGVWSGVWSGRLLS